MLPLTSPTALGSSALLKSNVEAQCRADAGTGLIRVSHGEGEIPGKAERKLQQSDRSENHDRGEQCGLNRCKMEIKQRLRGALRVEVPELFPQPCGLIPRLPRKMENEGGWAVKRRSDTAETNCSPVVCALLLSKMEEIREGGRG